MRELIDQYLEAEANLLSEGTVPIHRDGIVFPLGKFSENFCRLSSSGYSFPVKIGSKPSDELFRAVSTAMDNTRYLNDLPVNLFSVIGVAQAGNYNQLDVMIITSVKRIGNSKFYILGYDWLNYDATSNEFSFKLEADFIVCERDQNGFFSIPFIITEKGYTREFTFPISLDRVYIRNYDRTNLQINQDFLKLIHYDRIRSISGPNIRIEHDYFWKPVRMTDSSELSL